MDKEIDARRQKSVPGPVKGNDTDQEEDHHSGHRPEDRDIVQQKRHHAPKYRVTEATELHRNPGSDADQSVNHRNGEQIPANILLNLACDLDSSAFVLKARQYLNEPAQQAIARGEKEEKYDHRCEAARERCRGAGSKRARETAPLLHSYGLPSTVAPSSRPG